MAQLQKRVRELKEQVEIARLKARIHDLEVDLNIADAEEYEQNEFTPWFEPEPEPYCPPYPWDRGPWVPPWVCRSRFTLFFPDTELVGNTD